MSLDAMAAPVALVLDATTVPDPIEQRKLTPRERESARMRAARREARAKGLCIECPPTRRRSARLGKATCEVCAARTRRYQRKALREAKAKGLCGRCHRSPREVGSLCAGCHKKLKGYPSHGRNATRERLASQHLCRTGCGRSSFDRKTCAECRKDENEKRRQRVAERIAAGLCYRCGLRKAPSGESCSSCVKGRRSRADRRKTPRPMREKRCGACGEIGHRRSDRRCPVWKRRGRENLARREPQEVRRR